MEETKGKFITLTGLLMTDFPEELHNANCLLLDELACSHLELDPEEYYEAKFLTDFIERYAKVFDNTQSALQFLGKRIFAWMKWKKKLPEAKSPKETIICAYKICAANFEGLQPISEIIDSEYTYTFHFKCPHFPDLVFYGICIAAMEYYECNQCELQYLGGATFRLRWGQYAKRKEIPQIKEASIPKAFSVS